MEDKMERRKGGGSDGKEQVNEKSKPKCKGLERKQK